MKILIIGLGAAGFAAAIAAKKQDRKAEIIIIDKKDYDLSHPCGLPFYVEGIIKDPKNLKHNLGLEKMNIKKYANSEAIAIDTKDKKVVFKNKANEINSETYDKLIIASGAKPFVPPIPGVENTLKALDINDVEKIKERIKDTKKAVIIGAGAIGLEKAVALSRNNIEVHIVDIMKSVLPNLIDTDMSGNVEEFLESEGISLHMGKNIVKIEKDKIVLEDEEIESDMTILATGVRSSLDLVKDTSIKTEKGIIIDEFMKTNEKDIYAAGDIAQGSSFITKKSFSALLASSAYKQGTIAGINAAGGKISYEGSLGTFVSKIGNLEVAATGLNKEAAKINNHEIVIGKARAAIKPEWFPGSKKITLKLIFDKTNAKILGAQAIGEEGAASRINIISTAIKAGFSAGELFDIELAYCPAISDVKDVILIAAETAMRKLRL